MPNFIIKSRKLDREFSFYMPHGGGYVRLESGANHGTLGAQICYGGGFRGNTIQCDTEDEFKAECRKWYRDFVRNDF